MLHVTLKGPNRINIAFIITYILTLLRGFTYIKLIKYVFKFNI